MEKKCRECSISIVYPARLCDECRQKLAVARRRHFGRLQYERKRHGTARIGDIIKCADCSSQIVRNSSTRSLCEPCAAKRQRQSKWDQSRKRGRGARGDTAICAYCNGTFTKADGRQKFCSPCRAQDASAKLAAKRRGKDDPGFVLRRAIRTSMWYALKGLKRGRKWSDLVGYSVDDLKRHIERQFASGMSWANYGKWHIDHIVPLASFQIDGPDDPQLRAAYAMTNLRPLWARDNQTKREKRVLLL